MVTNEQVHEVYTNGHGEAALNFMKRRTLEVYGCFFLPFLKPGQQILDLGCGPGTMTAGLARRVGPHGSVVGVDRSDDQFKDARVLAEGLPVTFRAMDAYHLDFPEGLFDRIFSHALFEHLARPVAVLEEAYRVLKTGGVIGLRSPDWGGMIVHPDDARTRAALTARLELQTSNGGNVHAGRHLHEWLEEAGFTSIQLSANYEIYPDNTLIVRHIASQLEKDDQHGHAAAWRAWGENPRAMFAQAWFEAIGTKGENL